MWGCFLMSGVKILHFLKDWWKSIPIHQNYTMALIKMLHDVFDFPGNEVSKKHPHGAEEKRDNSSHPYPNSGAACHVSMIELLYSPIYSLSPPKKKKKKKKITISILASIAKGFVLQYEMLYELWNYNYFFTSQWRPLCIWTTEPNRTRFPLRCR